MGEGVGVSGGGVGVIVRVGVETGDPVEVMAGVVGEGVDEGVGEAA